MFSRPPDTDWFGNRSEIPLAHAEKEQHKCTFGTCTLSISLGGEEEIQKLRIERGLNQRKIIYGNPTKRQKKLPWIRGAAVSTCWLSECLNEILKSEEKC